LPGTLVTPLVAANCLHPRNGLRSILALWRAPERLAISPRWRQATPAMIDVAVFGEAALVAARRGDDGRPVPLALGRVVAPRGASDGVLVAELSRSNAGTLAVRGPMMPKAAFPPGAERGSLPYFRLASDGSADTGCLCRRGDDGSVMVTGSAPGLVNVGGYRFAMSELQDLVRRAGGEVELTALPDAILGQRLAGTAPAPEVVRKALAEIGVNPLLADAFRARHDSHADAA
jgi:non-ribosomal peptide synthetase component E (peptide arylation enzyme)